MLVGARPDVVDVGFVEDFHRQLVQWERQFSAGQHVLQVGRGVVESEPDKVLGHIVYALRHHAGDGFDFHELDRIIDAVDGQVGMFDVLCESLAHLELRMGLPRIVLGAEPFPFDAVKTLGFHGSDSGKHCLDGVLAIDAVVLFGRRRFVHGRIVHLVRK